VAPRTIISTPKAPEAVRPYAQAVKYGDLLFVSGMLPIDPKTNELVDGDFEAQCTQGSGEHQGHHGGERHVPEECTQSPRDNLAFRLISLFNRGTEGGTRLLRSSDQCSVTGDQ
jgi:hypothetical protein